MGTVTFAGQKTRYWDVLQSHINHNLIGCRCALKSLKSQVKHESLLFNLILKNHNVITVEHVQSVVYLNETRSLAQNPFTSPTTRMTICRFWAAGVEFFQTLTCYLTVYMRKKCVSKHSLGLTWYFKIVCCTIRA